MNCWLSTPTSLISWYCLSRLRLWVVVTSFRRHFSIFSSFLWVPLDFHVSNPTDFCILVQSLASTRYFHLITLAKFINCNKNPSTFWGGCNGSKMHTISNSQFCVLSLLTQKKIKYFKFVKSILFNGNGVHGDTMNITRVNKKKWNRRKRDFFLSTQKKRNEREREREGEERWEKGRGDDDDEDLGAGSTCISSTDNSTTHNNQSNRLHRQEKKTLKPPTHTLAHTHSHTHTHTKKTCTLRSPTANKLGNWCFFFLLSKEKKC